MKTCETCGTLFDGKESKRYCGVRCRRIASRQRERDRDPSRAAASVARPEPGHGIYATATNPSIAWVKQLEINRAREGREHEAIKIVAASAALVAEFDLSDAIDEPGTCYLL